MADIADQAQHTIEVEGAAMLAASRRPDGPTFTGHCAYCEAVVAEPMRFCDSECRDEFEHEAAAARRNGGAR